jgi:hypothetical protein
VQNGQDPVTMWMVVGFEVMPCSIKREKGDEVTNVACKPWGDASNPEAQKVYEGADIVYTYDVYWQESDIEWASRWDAYLRMPNGSVHWFSILNSLLVVLVMSVIVAVILMRTVRKDLAKYEELLVEGQVRRAHPEQGDPPNLTQTSAISLCSACWDCGALSCSSSYGCSCSCCVGLSRTSPNFTKEGSTQLSEEGTRAVKLCLYNLLFLRCFPDHLQFCYTGHRCGSCCIGSESKCRTIKVLQPVLADREVALATLSAQNNSRCLNF